ncbi:MAG TPA: adenylosuccinate synthetase, partial [Bacteroidota bacterium]|nr:adenylosuccinate synthetase [Bacteroidota bacterium]
GIPPTSITSVLGIVKAYSTRVGNGPFPTELIDETGEKLRTIGHEFGATTGRPRRCGWFDVVALKYSAMINGIKGIAITKLDVLDTFEEIKVCVGYTLNGKVLKNFTTTARELDKVQPVYETFEGWKTPISGITKYSDLPANARKYIEALARFTGTEIKMVSVGAKRDQTIDVK